MPVGPWVERFASVVRVVPGMRPGAIRWNVLVGLLSLLLLLLVLDLVYRVLTA